MGEGAGEEEAARGCVWGVLDATHWNWRAAPCSLPGCLCKLNGLCLGVGVWVSGYKCNEAKCTR